MAGMKDLIREYERARFPADCRLDLHGEGPQVARERALHWIQSRAHESPGQELLLIAGRGGTPGKAPNAVEAAVRKLLGELEGRLIEWWQPFGIGSIVVRVADRPDMKAVRNGGSRPAGEGRTEETAGAARPEPLADIPAELVPLAARAAELRIDREGLSSRILNVILREVWIEAQALAMDRRIGFERALEEVIGAELHRQTADAP